jgi:hypothetical protein
MFAKTISDASFRQRWLLPFLALWGLGLGLFTLLYSIDHAVTGGPSGTSTSAVGHYWLFDPEMVSNSTSALVGLMAAVLGIVITVVSIVVQLSANHYSGVASMFLRERVNIVVLGYYIVACILGVWIGFAVRKEFAPRLGIGAMIVMTTTGLALMGPYFSYVFRLLEPRSIIARIREQAVGAARSARTTTDDVTLSALQVRLLRAIENITDMASGAILSRDKVIAGQAVDALKQLALDYLLFKNEQPSEWFTLGAGLRSTPALVSLDPETKFALEHRKTWVEWQVMRQYVGIYRQALGQTLGLTNLIAIDTRYIAEAAAFAGDGPLVRLTGQFMNTYVRAALNARNVRTTCNVMNQIRLLVETLLSLQRSGDALAQARQMGYYAKIALDMNLPFVTEVVAYDLGTLCRRGVQIKFLEEDRLLEILIGLGQLGTSDKPVPLGVRKAQAKLAAYYLSERKPERAALIRHQLLVEPADRLRSVRDELLLADHKEYWEIVDRGHEVFDYLPPEQLKHLRLFFAWIEEPAAPAGPATA